MNTPIEQKVPLNTPPLNTPPPDIQENSSHKNNYWIAGIIIVVIILIVFAGYKMMKRNSQPQTSYNATNQSIAVNTPTPTVANTNQANSQTINKTNTSNQQLGQDLQNIQGNMNQLNADQASSDQSIQNQSSDTQQQ